MATARDTSSLYDLLEVGANASVEEIEASYRRIVSYLAPDALAVYSLMSEDEATSRRTQLDEAYRTLRDPTRRAAYDRSREGDGYPQVLVPAAAPGSTMSVGMLRAEADEGVPSLDVDAIFRSDGDSGDAEPARAAEAQVLAARPEPAPAREVVVEREPAPAARAPAPSLSTRPAIGVIASTTPRPRPTTTGTGEVAARTGAPPRRPPVAPSTTPRRLVPTVTAELTADSEFSGSLLRRLRESAGATLEDLARITKIRKHYLEAIEEHSFDLLPAAVYVRGFVTEYARVLGLDTQRVAQSYMAVYKRYRGEGV